MFTSAEEVVQQIEQRKNRGHGIQHFHAYMESIQHPQTQLRCIHVGGTNGKGSTTNYIRSMLQEAGYRVGSFTSPYIITHYDRIRINDVNIDPAVFLDIANAYYDSWVEWDLGMFEIDTCIAFLYFQREQVDFCVIEVGIGGARDCTNIIQPLVSVITNIGMDHMEILGDTKEQIADEKAGIIKPGIPCYTTEHEPSCLAIFKEHASQCQSKLVEVRKVPKVTLHLQGIQFSYGQYQDLKLHSAARYQVNNASLAIAVIEDLRDRGLISICEDQLRTALKKADWIGRFEIVHEDPYVILDGAHNAHGIAALVDSLRDMPNLCIIFSVLKDKNFEEMLNLLGSVTQDIVVTPFYNERALDVHLLEKLAHVQYDADYRHAIQAALAKGKHVVITGSLYFISEVRGNLMAHPEAMEAVK